MSEGKHLLPGAAVGLVGGLVACIVLTTMTFSSAGAQIGPNPAESGTALTDWRRTFPYSAANVVIEDRVTYGSLVNNNLGNNPADSPTKWKIIDQTGATATLPGAPNVVYNFVQPTDQGSSLSIADASGNGNDATLTIPPQYASTLWTGTGINFNCFYSCGNTPNEAQLPAAVGRDLTWCITAFNPTFNGLNPPTGKNNNTTFTNTYMYNAGAPMRWVAQAHDYGTQVGTQTYSPWISLNGAALTIPNYVPSAGMHTSCIVLGLSSNSTVDKVFFDFNQGDGFQINNSVSGDVVSGNWYLGQTTNSNTSLAFYYVAGWPEQLTPAQIQQATFAMNAAVAAKGVPVVPPDPLTGTPVYLAVGDSISHGGGALTTEWYPSMVNINAHYTVNNEGLPGFSAYAMASFALWKDAPQCYTGGLQSMATIFAGTNDVAVFGFTPAQAMSSIQSWVDVLKQAGCKVGVATMISRTGGADTLKDELNPLIRANAAAGGYFVVDMAATSLGADGAYENATLFNADQVHPTNAGQLILAQAASNAINAHGLGSASPAAPSVYRGNTVNMAPADVFTDIIPTNEATAWLPDCIGVTGTTYQVSNKSAGSNTVTFTGQPGQSIDGPTTAAPQISTRFTAQLVSDAAAGCYWRSVQ
jgi:lysophospholipase L1-like esterase